MRTPKIVKGLKPRPEGLPVPQNISSVETERLEKHSEKSLRDKLVARGDLCYKFQSENNRGVSDRLTIVINTLIFVEMKREGVTKLSDHQARFKRHVMDRKQLFTCVSGDKGVAGFLAWCRRYATKLENQTVTQKDLPELFK